MKEYIDRAKAINAIRQYQYPYGVEFLLANIPAADVAEVRHGRWIAFDPKNAESKECSMCGYLFSRLYPSNYCPNCGARMDKEDEHEAG